ncbi:peptide deformylase [Collinsella sp. TF11-5AC]|uniref:peptide deformylase n=1 Tax=Collinsella sp. TF11-5AC TaxID=2292336 RepID=UPI001F169697|nr:peptide deformylase [Collinsella sp. TF11-5AC]
MIKELCRDEAILSQRCEVATVEDESVAQDLIDTIKSLDDAGCLAANQIGVTKKVCVYLDDAGEPHVLYNPPSGVWPGRQQDGGELPDARRDHQVHALYQVQGCL